MSQRNRYQNRKSNNQNQYHVTEELKQKFSNQDFSLSKYDVEELIKDCEDFGKELSNGKFKMTQLRKFHSHFTKIWIHLNSKINKDDEFQKIRPQIQFSKVYLAYQAARKGRNNEGYKYFEEVVSTLIDKVKSPEDFEKLKKFIDAVVAYHKYYGGN